MNPGLKTKILSIDPHQPQTNLLEEAARVITEGGVVAFPTDTVYGLGANPYNDQAVDKIFRLKGRPPEKAILILIDNLGWLPQLVQRVNRNTQQLMDKFWPGPLTLILSANPNLRRYAIGGSGKVGIRWPVSLIAQGLVRIARLPVTATSANVSGKSSALDVTQVCAYFGDNLDLILDGGLALRSVGSTVVDVTGKTPRLIREGAVKLAELRQVCPVD